MDSSITYAREGDRVTLAMSLDDFEQLLVILGFAVGGALREDRDLAGSFLRFVNELNRTNPEFTPYAVEGDGAS